MRCRKVRGETTLTEAGRYDTQGDRKRDSVVARAISLTEPASAVSGATDCAQIVRGAKAMRASRTGSFLRMHHSSQSGRKLAGSGKHSGSMRSSPDEAGPRFCSLPVSRVRGAFARAARILRKRRWLLCLRAGGEPPYGILPAAQGAALLRV